MTSTENAPRHGAPTADRWFQRALPVTGLALVLVAVAALVVPGFRHQLVLSTSHQPQAYVELYFARTPAGTQVVCTGTGRSVRVSFAVTSHLPQSQHLRYDVSVQGSSTAGSDRQTGSTTVAPGRSVEVTRSLVRPAGHGYEVVVRLPAFDEKLLAHCPAGRS